MLNGHNSMCILSHTFGSFFFAFYFNEKCGFFIIQISVQLTRFDKNRVQSEYVIAFTIKIEAFTVNQL